MLTVTPVAHVSAEVNSINITYYLSISEGSFYAYYHSDFAERATELFRWWTKRESNPQLLNANQGLSHLTTRPAIEIQLD